MTKKAFSKLRTTHRQTNKLGITSAVGLAGATGGITKQMIDLSEKTEMDKKIEEDGYKHAPRMNVATPPADRYYDCV